MAEIDMEEMAIFVDHDIIIVSGRGNVNQRIENKKKKEEMEGKEGK